MGQPYVTGAVSVWIGSAAGPLFLGYSERGPNISIRPHYSNVFVDLSGMSVPFDKIYDGEEAIVSCDLTYFNQNVLLAIEDYAGTTSPGFNEPGEIGTLMLTEGIAYPLYLRFPYAAKPAFQNGLNGAMPAGYRFYRAMLETDDFPDLGTKARKIHLSWHCLPQLDATVSNDFGTGTFTLYDFDLSQTIGLVAA